MHYDSMTPWAVYECRARATLTQNHTVLINSCADLQQVHRMLSHTHRDLPKTEMAASSYTDLENL